MSRFYVCKFCHRKINGSFIAQHTIRNHVDRNYTIVDYDSQTVFEVSNNGFTGKIEITEEELNKKLGFST